MRGHLSPEEMSGFLDVFCSDVESVIGYLRLFQFFLFVLYHHGYG